MLSKKDNFQGVSKGILLYTDALYPSRLSKILGSKTPKELHFIGNINLLNKQGVGFCGSRKVSDKGLETAKDCAEQITTNNLIVISGNAAGVDLATHYTALKLGGSTILVIAEGINHFRIKKELKEVWDWSRVLVISQFQSDEIWQPFRAMSRNAVIIALSRAMVVIEAQEKGGTIEAGKSTLKLKLPLFVAEYRDMLQTQGNKMLLQLGAHRLMKSKALGKAQLKGLFEEINTPSYLGANNNPPTQPFLL